MKDIAVIDYGGANTASVCFALERLGVKPILTTDKTVIESSERVIFPGVGAAASSMEKINTKNLATIIQNLTQPVLGICLGMQLLFQHSEEGDVDMLDIIAAQVKHFDALPNISVPHMGWNTVDFEKDSPLLQNISNDAYFYFVHSYYAQTGDYTLASCDYMANVCALKRVTLIVKKNIRPIRQMCLMAITPLVRNGHILWIWMRQKTLIIVNYQ